VKLSFDRLREANVRRCEEVFHPLDAWSPTDWATAFAGEAGEACNVVKKLRRLDGADSALDTELKRECLRRAIGEELADAVIYADLLAARLGIDLGEAVRLKFNIVSAKREATVFL
jgi:NTP pyrophosphatase (non-canonical NTP hydrolase)